MPDFEVLTVAERDQWSQYLSQLPPEQQDIYFTPEYCELFTEVSGGAARCMVFKDGDFIALYPFHIDKVNKLGYNLDKDYYDIQGAYGYNGIVSNTDDMGFLDKLTDNWIAWCKDNNVIAEFIRYNPVLQNQNKCPWAAPVYTLENVLIPLTSFQEVWDNSFSGKVRTDIRKAIGYGLSFEIYSGAEISKDQYEKFIELYLSTMARRGADNFYLFSPDFFNKLIKELKNNIYVSFAVLDGTPVTADLFLHNNINSYGFLSGSLEEYNYLRANRFLRSEEMKFLIEKKFKHYSMGGGNVNNDSIFKYKKAFSIKTESKFYIGKCIHNEEVYTSVKSQWQLKYPHLFEKYNKRVLCYRDIA